LLHIKIWNCYIILVSVLQTRFFVQHRLYSSENLSKIYQILSEFAFDSGQSRIICAEKETAVTGQIKNCYIVIFTCLLKNM
jgi:hypothetical protein